MLHTCKDNFLGILANTGTWVTLEISQADSFILLLRPLVRITKATVSLGSNTIGSLSGEYGLRWVRIWVRNTEVCLMSMYDMFRMT